MRLLSILLVSVLGIALSGAQLSPAPPDVLARDSYPITLENGRLAGEGAELLIAAASKAQFVAIGEEHNNRYIPDIALSLFRTLHEREGFDYIADEQDPAMMRIVSSKPVRGDQQRIEELARRYPLGFTFISDEELHFLASVGAMSTARSRPIWGCEQAFGVRHVLDIVDGKAPTASAKSIAQRLTIDARTREARRDLRQDHYIAENSLAAPLRDLAAAYAGADPDTRFLVESLVKSNQIYGYYDNAVHDRLPGGYSNGSVREEYMKSVCLSEYRLAERTDRKMPKVLLKFGHFHLMDGLNPGNVTTLGNFFSNLARVNGTGYTSMAIFNGSEAGKPIWEVERLAYLRAFKDMLPSEGWRLIDLRMLREGPARRALFDAIAGLDPQRRVELTRLLYGFDFVLFLGPATPATFQVTGVNY
jgi:hypothetical protein